MATKWEDYTGMSFSDWQAMTKKPLIDIWEHIKGAADERVAFLQASHLSGGSFRAEPEFPSINELLKLTSTQLNTISENIFANPDLTALRDAVCVKNGTIQTGVSAPTFANLQSAIQNNNSNLARSITKAQCLQDVFGYAGTELDFVTDYNTGSDKILPLKRYIKQMFELLNYPVYYSVPFDGSYITEGDGGGTAQIERVEVLVIYQYNTSPTSGDSFVSAEAYVIINNGTPVSVYTTNDLDESGVTFSTMSDLLTLAQSFMDTYFDGTNYSSGVAPDREACFARSTPVSQAQYDSGSDTYFYQLDIALARSRYRYKTAQGYRPTSPDRFTYEVYQNEYYELEATDTSEFDFDTGKTDLNLEFNQLTADGSGYFNIDLPAGFSFDNVALPSVPASTEFYNSLEERIYRMSPDINYENWVEFGGYRPSLFVKPNLTSGNGFLYFTPS